MGIVPGISLHLCFASLYAGFLKCPYIEGTYLSFVIFPWSLIYFFYKIHRPNLGYNLLGLAGSGLMRAVHLILIARPVRLSSFKAIFACSFVLSHFHIDLFVSRLTYTYVFNSAVVGAYLCVSGTGTETASYKVLSMGKNVYDMGRSSVTPPGPLIAVPLTSKGSLTHRFAPTTVLVAL